MLHIPWKMRVPNSKMLQYRWNGSFQLQSAANCKENGQNSRSPKKQNGKKNNSKNNSGPLKNRNKCGVGKRGQTPKSATGLENEVRTPRQLRQKMCQISSAAHIRIFLYILQLGILGHLLAQWMRHLSHLSHLSQGGGERRNSGSRRSFHCFWEGLCGGFLKWV